MKFSARQVLGFLAAADRQNGELEETYVAEVLGVEVDELGKALAALSCLGMPPFGPDDLIDLRTDDPGWVYVTLPPGLRGAALPSLDDVAVLEKAFDSLAATPEQRTVAVALLTRLRGAAPANANPVGWGVDPVDPEVIGVIGQAVREGRSVKVKYYNKSQNSSFPWVVRPVALIQHAGRWYVDAVVGENLRWLRVDRMLAAELGDVTPVAPGKAKRDVKRDVLYDGGAKEVEAVVVFPEGADVVRRVYGASPRGAAWVVRGSTNADVLRNLLACGLPFTLEGPKALRELLARWVA